MAIKYKVWIEIEQETDEKEFSTLADLDFPATKTFDKKEDAIKFANKLHEIGRLL